MDNFGTSRGSAQRISKQNGESISEFLLPIRLIDGVYVPDFCLPDILLPIKR